MSRKRKKESRIRKMEGTDKEKAHTKWKQSWAPKETPCRKERYWLASYENNAMRVLCRTQRRKDYRQWYQGDEIMQ